MISVLIASMGRPHLADTLASVMLARVPDGQDVEIIVADDSPDGKAARLVATLDLVLRVIVLPVGAGNVALARNACLDAARGEWLIFVDDDETVEPEWMQGHLSAATDFEADAVFGPVFPIYPSGTPDWFVRANPLFGDWGWSDDGRVVGKGRTGNTLICRSALGSLRFDPAYGRSGGEDDDFFLRFFAAGHRMVVTDRARAHEMVPAERASVSYALSRAERTGQLYARLRVQGRGFWFALRFWLGALAKLAVLGLGSLALRPFDRAGALRLAMRAHGNRGQLKAIGSRGVVDAWK